MFSTNQGEEPRFQVASWSESQPMFAINVESLMSGESATFDANTPGYPVENIAELPEGEYYVQGMLHRYTTFNRADEHTVKLPMDQWEGQNWRISPGNLYTPVRKVHVDPSEDETLRLRLTERIPPFEPLENTKYIKHEKIRSDILSEFWGRDMHIGATLLLPEGWKEHPQARYPVAYYQGHFHREFYTPVGFRPEPAPDSLSGYDSTYAAYSHKFYEDWTGPDFPRMIIVTLKHPTPYFDDSYAVNSANNGPYGDALTKELLPYLEEKYRAIGEGWARTLYGGSTGGWESLAWQIFYPEMFNGTWSSCPDPVDFRHYGLVDIYEDENAFYPNREWENEPSRPFMREVDGEVLMTVNQASQMERVLGTKGRSGQQLDIWQATYGPVGKEGYPKPIWNKKTGEIDHEVAEYMQENYDLRYILERDWDELGPKLKGKLHIYVGNADNFYLEEGVRHMEKFLESTTEPYYDGVVEYGDRYNHCWSGAEGVPNRISRLTYNQRFLPKMADHITRTAPPDADTTSWKY